MSMDPNPNPDLHVQIDTMADFSVRFSITLECPNNQHSSSEVSQSAATSHMQLISPQSTTPSANYQTTSNSTHSGLKTGKIGKICVWLLCFRVFST